MVGVRSACSDAMPWIVYAPIKVSFHITTLRTHGQSSDSMRAVRETSRTFKARQMLEHAIEKSRGGVFLKLTPEQHARWKRP
jgi:hypothetical protein